MIFFSKMTQPPIIKQTYLHKIIVLGKYYNELEENIFFFQMSFGQFIFLNTSFFLKLATVRYTQLNNGVHPKYEDLKCSKWCANMNLVKDK